MNDGVQRGPAVEYAQKPLTLESLAKLNEHDRVVRALEHLLANGELDDYDDELANRVRDAIRIVRGVTVLGERTIFRDL